MSLERRRYDHDDDDRPARRPDQPTGTSPLVSVLLLVLGAAVAGLVIWLVTYFRGKPDAPPLTNPEVKLRETTPKEPPDHEERESIDLFKKLKPSVVNVDIVQQQRVGWDDRVAERTAGAGSGFIW